MGMFSFYFVNTKPVTLYLIDHSSSKEKQTQTLQFNQKKRFDSQLSMFEYLGKISDKKNVYAHHLNDVVKNVPPFTHWYVLSKQQELSDFVNFEEDNNE